MTIRTEFARASADDNHRATESFDMTTNRLFPLLLGLGILLVPPTACDSSIQGPSNDDGPYSHARSVGASAHDLLADDAFSRLVVEVAEQVVRHDPDPHGDPGTGGTASRRAHGRFDDRRVHADRRR